jgi:catechol 2,3-dioxygenase-like lactoylglutathione lyase family enzyme
MISHVHLGTADLERAVRFYAPIMEILGNELRFHEPEHGWAGWQRPGAARPLFLVGRPFDGGAPHPGNGVMAALLAPSRAAVDAAFAAALAGGGRSEGGPGLRPRYHPDYYGAYFRDPDGNKLCVCCHDPA